MLPAIKEYKNGDIEIRVQVNEFIISYKIIPIAEIDF